MTDHALAGIGGDVNVAREHAKQDELVAQLDDDQLVPPAAFPSMLETLSRLRELPDHLAWFATRYLQACVVHGHRMFPRIQQQQLGVPTSEVLGTMRCYCEADAPIDHRKSWRDGRLSEMATCPDCGTVLARFDGEPYDRQTLYAPGLS